MKLKIRLDTMKDVNRFISIVSQNCSPEDEVMLIDGNKYCVNAKSLLGAVACLEWNDLYVVSDKDISSYLSEFYI